MRTPAQLHRRAGWATAVALAGSLCWMPASRAGTPAGGNSATSAPWDMAAVIRRIQEAPRQRSFIGTYVVTTGGHLSSSRITHFCDGRDQIERIESLDGQMRRVFRHNDAVHVFWPGTKTALIEQRDLVGRFPSPLQPGDAARLEMYEMQAGGDDRIAGHDAQVVTFQPRDQYRYARRLWLDRRTGLLLRSDLINEQGDIIESSAFSELQVGARLQAQPLLLEMNRLEGYKVSKPTYVASDLDSEGWTMRQPVNGFETQRVVRRPMPAAPDAAATTGSMVQAVYSDGLTHVSVFIEPFVAGQHKRENPATVGSTSALSRRQGDWWITAVGAVPVSTLQQFTSGLERRKP